MKLPLHRHLPTTLRYVVAIACGAVAVFVFIADIEAIGHAIYPTPSDIDFSDPDNLAKLIQELPIGAFMFVLVSWF
jgi:hypothetical protein